LRLEGGEYVGERAAFFREIWHTSFLFIPFLNICYADAPL
jgi:hypothetical protein